MPKVKTEFIRVGHESDPDFIKFRFNIDININSKGIFYTYIPEKILPRLQHGNIKFDTPLTNGRQGCLRGASINEVVDKTKAACREASSRKLAGETIVIKYAIRTACTYCISKDGAVVPNGQNIWTGKGDAYEWKQGTIIQHARAPAPFGFEMYAKPYYRRKYIYCNGRESIEYAPLYDGVKLDEHYYLAWLAAVCAVTVPDETKIQEIEYTEDVARFFVETYKSLCALNERIKGFLDPEGIKQIAASKIKMLGNG